MKYIKPYNKLFESDSPLSYVKDIIHDTIQELKDDGFDVRVMSPLPYNKEIGQRVYGVRVTIAKSKLFGWSDVKDGIIQTIHTIKDETELKENIQIEITKRTNYGRYIGEIIFEGTLDKLLSEISDNSPILTDGISGGIIIDFIKK